MSALPSALALAGRGFAVFPCLPSKAPACPHGHRDATRDAAGVRALWGRWPGILIGTPTGAANGFDVLDIDPRHGGDESLRDLEQRWGALPDTPVAHTGGGGEHYWFAHPGGRIPDSVGVLGPGLDVRGDGGA